MKLINLGENAVLIYKKQGNQMKNRSNFKKEKLDSMTLSSIIPTLVSGLYNDTFDLVREYCQNSYDAILLEYGNSAEKKGRIDITIKKGNVVIHDNGTGMSYDIVKKCATIGFSSKDVKNQVGYRGVGRLSGICAADKLHFVTKIEDSLDEYIFEINAKNLVSSLDRDTKFNIKASSVILKHSRLFRRSVSVNEKKRSYTTVILYGIYGEAGKLLDEDKLRSYLEINLPVFIHPELSEASEINRLYREHEELFPNIPIFLNGKQIFKPFHEMMGNKKYKSMVLNNSRGRKLAVVWYIWDSKKSCMIEQKRIRGLRYRSKGFTIGNNEYVKSILNTSPPQLPDWFIGEIIVLDDRARVSSDRSRFEDTLSRSEIEDALKTKLAKDLEQIARKKSGRASDRRIIEKARKDLKSVDKKIRSSKYISNGEKSLLIKDAKDSIKKLESLEKKRRVSTNYKNDIKIVKKGISERIKNLSVKNKATVDLEKILTKSPIALQVHEITKEAIKQYFHRCDSYEELLSHIGQKLLNTLN